MAEERTRRAVLVGADMGRLLALADELEARGLEVALYREAERGIAACANGECDILVAIGRLAPRDGAPSERVSVPLVLLDAPDAPDLPLRPIGPRTALGATVLPAAAAERVLSLLSRAPDAASAAPPAQAADRGGQQASPPRPPAAEAVAPGPAPAPAPRPAPLKAVVREPEAPRTIPPERVEVMPPGARERPEPPAAESWGAEAAAPVLPPPGERPAQPSADAVTVAADEATVAAPSDRADRISSLRRTITSTEDAARERVEREPAERDRAELEQVARERAELATAAAVAERPAPRSRRNPSSILLIIAGLALGAAFGLLVLGIFGMPGVFGIR